MVATPVTEVPVGTLSLGRLGDAPGAEALPEVLDRAADRLAGARVWCVNSTAVGGGVAQMLRSTLAYTAGAGIDARWAVIGGTPEFFSITKRLHHALHGRAPGQPFDDADREQYGAVLAANAEALAAAIRPGDVVVLHDPQTAGLAPALREAGARVLWRVHVGADQPNEHTRAAWAFLRPSLADVHAYVFSTGRFVWPGIPAGEVGLITPAIDPADVKNLPLGPGVGQAVLAGLGLRPSHAGVAGEVVPVDLLQDRPLRDDEPFVLHLSRWDPLKDPVGLLRSFTEHVAPVTGAALVLAGPSPSGVADDPEGDEVLAAVQEAWTALDPAVRDRVHVIDLAEGPGKANGLAVNALQHSAAVIVKKSLAEGFGLGVTEALWKARPVVAPAVGGVREQVIDRVTGLLVGDPADRRAFGAAVVEVLSDRRLAAQLGEAGRRRVRERFLEPMHLLRWSATLGRLVVPPRHSTCRGGAIAAG